MSAADFALLALIVCAAVLALRSCRKRKKSGRCVGCGGNCACCHAACGKTALSKGA